MEWRNGMSVMIRDLLTSIFLGIIFFGSALTSGGAIALLAQDAAPVVTASDPSSISPTSQARDVCVVIGAEGEKEYGESFRASARRWQEAFEWKKNPASRFLLIDGTTSKESKLSESSDSESKDTESKDTLVREHRDQLLDWIQNGDAQQNDQRITERWLVLIGHGTYEPTKDSSGAKFNLRGPDITPESLSQAIEQHRKTSNATSGTSWIIVNCSSCSGPFINVLSKPDRIVITATKSGAEQNYSRFGDYLSRALLNRDADLDHDKSVSLLESFLLAANQTRAFYENDNRLPSEQSLLDDNGDKRGTPESFFQGTRPLKSPDGNLQIDGLSARRLIVSHFEDAELFSEAERIAVEEAEDEIEKLRQKKSNLSEDEYYQELEKLFREIIRIRKSSDNR